MDVAGSVAMLLSGGLRMGNVLDQFISRCINAPDLAQTVHFELHDFTFILSKLQPIVLRPVPLNLSMIDINHLSITLTGCAWTFSALEKEISGLKVQRKMDILDRIKWSQTETTIVQLIQRLQNHKHSLTLILTILKSEFSDEAIDSKQSLDEQLIKGIPNISNPQQRTLDSTGDHSANANSSPAADNSSSVTVDDDDANPVRTITSSRSVGSFEFTLLTSRPYRRMSNNSLISLASPQRQKGRWSFFSRGSNTSVRSLPTSMREVSGVPLPPQSPHLPALPHLLLATNINTRPNQRPTVASVQSFDDYKLETEFHDGYVVHNISTTRLLERSTWEQKEKIGSGTFGNVWLQKKREGGQLRAVKVLLRGSLSISGFSQELLALVKLKDYGRFFVKFFGWYDNSDCIYLAMEYIEHGDLHEYMLKDPHKPKAEAREITRQILMGLEILHKQEICHRDLKPQNILIASPSPIWVKIADFGAAKRTNNTTARTGWGTEGYSAPEQLRALPKSLYTTKFPAALDIWSLGSLVHKLLTSETPFANTDGDSASETGVMVEQDYGTDLNSLFSYCHGTIEFPVGILQKSLVSDEGIAFVKGLLVPDPKDRPTASIALQEPWLQGL